MASRTWECKETDDFSTSPKMWKALLKPLKPGTFVFDPCYFDGKAKELIENLGHRAIHECKDFLAAAFVVPEYDLLATNPPFSNIKAFLRKIVDITIETGKPFAILLPVVKKILH